MAAHSVLGLVSGHGGTPVPLDQLSAPLLKDFAARESILTHWHDFVSREMSGDRTYVPVGLPWTEWVLFRVSRAEFAFLMTYTGDVTITCLNQTENQYQTFNATLKPPEANSSDAEWSADGIGGWSDVKLTFFDLVQIV